MDCTHVDVSLELRVAGEELEGTVRTATAGGRPFTGWLGLIAAIDAVVADAGERRSPVAVGDD